MKLFFIVLLFGKTTLLTTLPITIHSASTISINLKKPISAITNGASLLIDVSSTIDNIEEKSITELRKDVKNMFGDFSLKAELTGGAEVVTLLYSGNSMIKAGQVLLSLNSQQKISELGAWSKINVTSSKTLVDVHLLWKNFSK